MRPVSAHRARLRSHVCGRTPYIVFGDLHGFELPTAPPPPGFIPASSFCVWTSDRDILGTTSFRFVTAHLYNTHYYFILSLPRGALPPSPSPSFALPWPSPSPPHSPARTRQRAILHTIDRLFHHKHTTTPATATDPTGPAHLHVRPSGAHTRSSPTRLAHCAAPPASSSSSSHGLNLGFRRGKDWSHDWKPGPRSVVVVPLPNPKPAPNALSFARNAGPAEDMPSPGGAA